MKVLVTGSNGFLGRHVVDALASHGGLELIASSRAPAPARALPKGVRYMPWEIATASDGAFAALGSPDVLVHLAWSGLPNYKSLHHFESELPLQYGFVRALIEQGLSNLVVAGTCFEYGMAFGEISETQPADPTNPYGFAKAALLKQLRFLQRSKPFSLTWTRLFYMYGEGQAPTSLYSLLRAAAERGDKTFPMSSGEQIRDYLPVEDAAKMLSQLALRCDDAGVVNLCSGKPVSVRGQVERLMAENGWHMSLDRGKYPVPDYEPFAFWGSAQKLDRLLAS